MTTQTTRQLTPYETQLYFIPDTSAINQRKKELNALNAEIQALDTQLSRQLSGITHQTNNLSHQLNLINTREKGVKTSSVQGLILIIADVLSVALIALASPSLKLLSLAHIDTHLYQVPYFVLLAVESYLLANTKKSKNLYLYVVLWVCWSLLYFNYLINLSHNTVSTDAFYLYLAFHLYLLYRGFKLVYTSAREEQKNVATIQQNKQQIEDLKRKREQIKKEQQQKLQQKKSQKQKLQQKAIKQTPAPTDQEFDAWLENKVRESLVNTLRKLGLESEIANPRKLLRVRGYVLPGMRDARHYRSDDLRYKLGADGKRRYSINLYTYFYPAERRIMVFTYNINALNWNDYRETMREYFYQDIIGATTEDDHDTLYIDGKPHNYRTQRFSLRLCDGTAISATVRSNPLDTMANLPDFDIPQSNIDSTINQLRLLLREKK